MKVLLIFVVFLGTLEIDLATASVALAQSPPVALTVIPSIVTLAPEETVQSLVIAKLSSPTVQAISLSAFSDAGVQVAIDNARPTQSPLRGDLGWTVAITRLNTGHPDGKVYFRADYRVKENGGQSVPGLVTASMDIQERVPDTIDKVITANLETALETLQDRQSRQVFVVIRNSSNVPVTVARITPLPVPHITTCTEDLEVIGIGRPPWVMSSDGQPVPIKNWCLLPVEQTEGFEQLLGKGVRLEPQQAHPFSLTLTADDTVQPGKQLLIVRVDAKWEKAGQQTTGSLVLPKEFKIGVFGESAILEATTIPSVLLLPGFLFTVTLILLIKWSWSKTLLDLDFKKPEFWFVAITLSLIAILIYPILTGPLLSFLLRRPMPSRNLLQGYGFNDILLLWLGAVLIGFMVWAVGSSFVWLGMKGRAALTAYRVRREQEQRAALIPAQDDPPLVILRKIANNQKGLDLTQARYPKGNAPQLVFVLPSGVPEPGKLWVAPRISLHWRKADDAMKDEFDTLLGNPHDVRSLIHRLEGWQNPQDPIVELDWDRSGQYICQPKQVEQQETEEVNGDESFFLQV